RRHAIASEFVEDPIRPVAIGRSYQAGGADKEAFARLGESSLRLPVNDRGKTNLPTVKSLKSLGGASNFCRPRAFPSQQPKAEGTLSVDRRWSRQGLQCSDV